jgi:hypothetical protein
VKVRDEAADAWEKWDGGPTEVLKDVATRQVVVQSNWNVGKVGKEVHAGVAFS